MARACSSGAGVQGVSLPHKLEPFDYQVGGHFVLMKLGASSAICKPSGKRETYFYQSIPEVLREFVPAFHGKRYNGVRIIDYINALIQE